MGATHLYGKPINVLKFSKEKKLLFDKTELDEIFLQPEVESRKIVIVSIIGAFRKGKSFLLDYCLRFMYANYKSIANPSNDLTNKTDWMGAKEEPLKGFSWKSGTSRDTTGIIMWSDVFLHTNNNGEKLAIVLMDTQGLFDNETTQADNSRIFALGTLLSSVQILNLFNIIQEDQLQYLQFATEFVRFAALDKNHVDSKCFQNLWFLIRDWNNPDEYDFGIEGGRYYLKNVLEMKEIHKSELKSVRQFIKDSFEQLECCLMPAPGPNVSRNSKYNGNWGDMDNDFKNEMINLLPKLLAPENLVLKKINNKDINCSEMKEYIETYFTLFQSDILPEAQSIYETTIEKQMNILIGKCLEAYQLNINKNQDHFTKTNLHIFHENSKNASILLYKDEKKMGNSEHENKYRIELENQNEITYLTWKEQTLKNIEKIESEQQKAEDALKENAKLLEEAEETEKIAVQQKKDLEKEIEVQKLEADKHELEKKLLESKEDLEKERANEAEKQVENEKLLREKQNQAFEDKLVFQKEAMEAERLVQKKINELEINNLSKLAEANKVQNEKEKVELQLQFEKQRNEDLVKAKKLQNIETTKLQHEKQVLELNIAAEQQRANEARLHQNAVNSENENKLREMQLQFEKHIAKLQHEKQILEINIAAEQQRSNEARLDQNAVNSENENKIKQMKLEFEKQRSDDLAKAKELQNIITANLQLQKKIEAEVEVFKKIERYQDDLIEQNSWLSLIKEKDTNAKKLGVTAILDTSLVSSARHILDLF